MRQNIDPKQWGPAAWHFLEESARACDENSRRDYNRFMRLLPCVLPCEFCRRHATEYLEENPPEESVDLQRWLADFKASVARRRASVNRADASPRTDGPILLLFVVLGVATLVAIRFAQR